MPQKYRAVRAETHKLPRSNETFSLRSHACPEHLEGFCKPPLLYVGRHVIDVVPGRMRALPVAVREQKARRELMLL